MDLGLADDDKPCVGAAAVGPVLALLLLVETVLAAVAVAVEEVVEGPAAAELRRGSCGVGCVRRLGSDSSLAVAG